MAFTGSITRKEVINGKLRIHYSLDNGEGIVINDFFETSTARPLAWVANYVLARANEVDSLSAFHDAIPLGVVVKPADPAPTPKDPIIENFLIAFGEAKAMRQLVDNGVIPASHAMVVSARDELRRQFQDNPGYLNAFKTILRN